MFQLLETISNVFAKWFADINEFDISQSRLNKYTHEIFSIKMFSLSILHSSVTLNLHSKNTKRKHQYFLIQKKTKTGNTYKIVAFSKGMDWVWTLLQFAESPKN